MPGAVVEPGSQIDDFEIIAEIGHGAMGTVYRARQLSLNREVALKIVHSRLAWDDEVLARFRREGLALAALEHPGIVRVYSVGDDRGRPFLAMQLVEGNVLDSNELQARLNPADPQAIQLAVGIAIQVLDSLECAHRAGIVHRDVKPENVVVTDSGKATLVDFGLAVFRDQVRATVAGHAVGSPAYMSPERLNLSAGDLPVASDVWSVGVLLFESLAGKLPFGGDNAAEVSRMIATTRAPNLCSVEATGIPKALAAIVQKALEPSRSLRFETAKDFADDLRAFLQDGPIQAMGLGQRCRSHFAAFSTRYATVVLALLITTVVAFSMKTIRNESRSKIAKLQAAILIGETTESPLDVRLSILLAESMTEGVNVVVEPINHFDGRRGAAVSLGSLPVTNASLKRGDYLLHFVSDSGRRAELFESLL